MPQTLRPHYGRPARLSRWLIAFLALEFAVVCVEVVALIQARFPLVRLRRGDTSSEVLAAVQQSADRYAILSLGQLVIGLAVSALFAVWVYRVARNAHALTVKPMRFTAGSAVWWYFVPLFNWFRPYQAFHEIWTVSADPDAPSRVRAPDILPFWWFLTICGYLGTTALVRYVYRLPDEPNTLLVENNALLFLAVVSLPLSLVIIRIVVRLNRLQASYNQRLHAEREREAGSVSPPAPVPA